MTTPRPLRSQRLYLLIAASVLVAAAALWWWRASKGPKPEQPRPALSGESPHPGSAPAAPRSAGIRAAELGGIVVDIWGAPVAGAWVCAHGNPYELDFSLVWEPRCALADADGRFQLAVAAPSAYWLSATAAGHLPAALPELGERPLRLVPEQRLEELRLVMMPGGVPLDGIVVDVNGGPIAGAVISLRERWPPLATRTGSDGRFRVWVAPGWVEVLATAAGYTDGHARGLAPGGAVELHLTPESILAGRVVRAGSGEPVPEARVSLGMDGIFATSDADGRFRFERLLPGRYQATAEAFGASGWASASVLLGLGETREDLIIEVHPAYTVRARVVTADGETCPLGYVGLIDEEQDRVAAAVVVDGDAVLRAVFPGHYRVQLSCDEFSTQNAEYAAVDVVDRDIDRLVWKVGRGAQVRGRVLDGSGGPVPGARVRAVHREGNSTLDSAETVSRLDGSFRLSGLEGLGDYQVTATAAGFMTPRDNEDRDAGDSGPKNPVVALKKGDEATVELLLARGGVIRGQVVTSSGEAVAGASVDAGNASAETGADGSFEATGVRAGEQRVTARRNGFALLAPGRGEPASASVTVGRDGEASVRLVVELPGGVIRGRVMDGAGKPIIDAFVEAHPEQVPQGYIEPQPIVTDLEGRFSIANLAPDRYTLRAHRRGGGEAVQQGVAAGSAVELTIGETGSIAGTISTAAGAPPETYRITVEQLETGMSRDEEFFRTRNWRIADLPAGTYALQARTRSGALAGALVRLASGKAVDGVGLRLAPGGRVRGRLLAAGSGKPVTGVSIATRLAGSPRRTPARSVSSLILFPSGYPDDEGRFLIEELPAGRMALRIYSAADDPGARFRESWVEVEIPAGGEVDIGDIALQPGP